MIAGSRVGSPATPQLTRWHQVTIDELNHRIARCIPFYPQSIRIADIARQFHLATWKVEQRIETVQDAYLIVESDERTLSRLRDDLSNVEACRG